MLDNREPAQKFKGIFAGWSDNEEHLATPPKLWALVSMMSISSPFRQSNSPNDRVDEVNRTLRVFSDRFNCCRNTFTNSPVWASLPLSNSSRPSIMHNANGGRSSSTLDKSSRAFVQLFALSPWKSESGSMLFWFWSVGTWVRIWYVIE